MSNSKNKKLPCCPYCKERLSYFDAMAIKSDIVYKCSNCERVSVVLHRSDLTFYSKVAVIMSVLAFLGFSFTGGIKFWQIFVVILPYILFYAKVPFSLSLDTVQNRFVTSVDDLKHSKKTAKKVEKQEEQFVMSRKQQYAKTNIRSSVYAQKSKSQKLKVSENDIDNTQVYQRFD